MRLGDAGIQPVAGGVGCTVILPLQPAGQEVVTYEVEDILGRVIWPSHLPPHQGKTTSEFA